MPRKKRDFTREILPDPKFHEVLITRMINVLMRRGKRGVAERSMYGALDQVEKKLNQPALEVFKKAIANVRPMVEVRSRRVGGANYQVPTEVAPHRSESLAIRWICQATSSRTERELKDRIANELMEASGGRGFAMKKREDTHKMAEANKAFAHFKW
jgi:small subunit ribosomal protein S7